MRKLRFVPERGTLVEVTCRTIQGRFLLEPDSRLNPLILGVLGRAQRRYGMRICAFAFLANHFHLLLDVDDAWQLSRFMGYVNSNLAREAGRLAKWCDRFWARRYQAVLVTEEEEAQVARLVYVLSQGTKEGLVRTPLDWPGVHCAAALAQGKDIEGVWIDRTGAYKARQRSQPPEPEQFRLVERVTLSPIPAWKDLTPEAYRKNVADLIAQIEVTARQQNSSNSPKSERRAQRSAQFRPKLLQASAAPFCHAAHRAARLSLVGAYRWFFSAFRAAAEKLARGELQPSFPPGSFPPGLPFVRG